jgi:hypothetical protein
VVVVPLPSGGPAHSLPSRTPGTASRPSGVWTSGRGHSVELRVDGSLKHAGGRVRPPASATPTTGGRDPFSSWRQRSRLGTPRQTIRPEKARHPVRPLCVAKTWCCWSSSARTTLTSGGATMPTRTAPPLLATTVTVIPRSGSTICSPTRRESTSTIGLLAVRGPLVVERLLLVMGDGERWGGVEGLPAHALNEMVSVPAPRDLSKGIFACSDSLILKLGRVVIA